MSRTYKAVPVSLDPRTESMLNILVSEQKEWDYNRSALMRRLIQREFRSHIARKRIAAKAASTGEPSHEQQ